MWWERHSRLGWSPADDLNDIRPRGDIWEVWLPLLQLFSQSEGRKEEKNSPNMRFCANCLQHSSLILIQLEGMMHCDSFYIPACKALLWLIVTRKLQALKSRNFNNTDLILMKHLAADWSTGHLYHSLLFKLFRFNRCFWTLANKIQVHTGRDSKTQDGSFVTFSFCSEIWDLDARKHYTDELCCQSDPEDK